MTQKYGQIGLSNILIFCFGLFFGCKTKQNNEDQSITKTSARAAEEFQFDSLEGPQKQAICNTRAMVVFIGNGESRGTMTFSPALIASGTSEVLKNLAETDESNYFMIVQDAELRLRAALAKTQCSPNIAGSVDLLSILDGPKDGDSSIAVTSFGWVQAGSEKHWSVLSESTSYVLVDENAVLKSNVKNPPMEINLPKSVGLIVSKVDELLGRHEQIAYFIKSHGGKVALNAQEPTSLLTLKKEQVDSLEMASMLLADSHAGKQILKSDIYGVSWSTEKACKIYQRLNVADKAAAANCAAKVDLTKVLGAAKSRAGVAKKNLDALRSLVQNQETSGSVTQNQDIFGSVTQGQGTEGSVTQGQEFDGSVTQGQGGEGSITQGQEFGGSVTQGQDGLGSSTQGAGKQLLLLKSKIAAPDLAKVGSDDNSPDIIVEFGAAGTYGKGLEGNNIYSINLPMGTKPLSKISMVVLDSCYGTNNVASMFSEATQRILSSKGNGAEEVAAKALGYVPSVILRNEAATYFYTIHYEVLTSTMAMGLQHLVLWSNGAVTSSVLGSNVAGTVLNDQSALISVRVIDALSSPNAQDVAALRVEMPYLDKVDESYLKMKAELMTK